MLEFEYSPPAEYVPAPLGEFHSLTLCRYNECRHNRWEPRQKGERRGHLVCAIKDGPRIEFQRCQSYSPNKQHREIKEPEGEWPDIRWDGPYGDGSYSGHSGIDELGLGYSDFGIPVWGSD